MRKPRRLPAETVDPFVWTLPEAYRRRWGDRPADAAPTPEVIDWEKMFGNANPVEIEVGFGKGLFLVTAGEANPGKNYFGVEIERKYQMYAAGRVAGRGLTNVRTCCGDAKKVLEFFVAPQSVAAVHVYFPDPWWKAKHKKRTLFTAHFADLVFRVLKPGGILHFATDVPDYFEMVTAVLAGKPAFRPLPRPAEKPPEHGMDYLTNFERKFRLQGKPIHRAEYESIPTFA